MNLPVGVGIDACFLMAKNNYRCFLILFPGNQMCLAGNVHLSISADVAYDPVINITAKVSVDSATA